MQPPFTTREQQGSLDIQLQHAWDIHHLETAQHALAALHLPQGKNLTLDATQLASLDSSGAWTLLKFAAHAEEQGSNVTWRGFTAEHEELLQLLQNVEVAPLAPIPISQLRDVVEWTGKKTITFVEQFLDSLAFIGETSIAIGRTFRNPSRFRLFELTHHIQSIGINAIPIVMLMAFLISIVLTYQGSGQLRQFGADIFTVDLVAISILREMGVLLTAIMVAGRSGSAFAAEIGVMKINEEVDALRTLGIHPFDMLVLPRVLGMMISLPILTFLANIAGLLATAIACYLLLDISPNQFIERLWQIKISTFFIGMIKAPVFAFLIAIIGCERGMRVKNSAEMVGRQTTAAVVLSIFVVILADALFSILFTSLKI